MQTIVIELDETNGNLKVQHPDNMILTLGLIDYFRELLMVQRIRPNMSQRIMPAGAMPLTPPQAPPTQ